MLANCGEARSSSLPSGKILPRIAFSSGEKSAIPDESSWTADQSPLIPCGGWNAISRHSAPRSITVITLQISSAPRTTPEMRDCSRIFETSSSPEKLKVPPARRNSRISAVSSCCDRIHAKSGDGARACTRARPKSDAAYPRTSSRKRSNSRRWALVFCILCSTLSWYCSRRCCAVIARAPAARI